MIEKIANAVEALGEEFGADLWAAVQGSGLDPEESADVLFEMAAHVYNQACCEIHAGMECVAYGIIAGLRVGRAEGLERMVG